MFPQTENQTGEVFPLEKDDEPPSPSSCQHASTSSLPSTFLPKKPLYGDCHYPINPKTQALRGRCDPYITLRHVRRQGPPTLLPDG